MHDRAVTGSGLLTCDFCEGIGPRTRYPLVAAMPERMELQVTAHAHDDRHRPKCRNGTRDCFIGRWSHTRAQCNLIPVPDARTDVDTSLVDAVERLTRQREDALNRVDRAARTIVSMACEIHQAYHEGDPTTCHRGFCVGARNSANNLRGKI